MWRKIKKEGLSLIVLLGFIFSGVNAQDNINVGFKVSMNGFNYATKDASEYSSTMKYGTSLSGVIPVQISNHFIIQPELNVYLKSTLLKHKLNGTTEEMIVCGAEVPVYAIYRWPLRGFCVNAGVGSYIGTGFVAANLTSDTDLYDTEYLKRLDFGWGYTIGCNFKFGLSINVEHKFGLINAFDSLKKENKMFPRTLGISIGYVIACN